MKVPKFYSSFDPVKPVPSCPGNIEEDVFERVYDANGGSHLEVVGKRNIPDSINAFKDECDIYTILSRYSQTGDISILDRKEGVYLDATGFPRSLAEMHKVCTQARAYYDSLSDEERKKCTYEEWLAKVNMTLEDGIPTVYQKEQDVVSDAENSKANTKVGEKNES